MDRSKSTNRRADSSSSPSSDKDHNHHGIMYNYLHKLFEKYKLSSILLVFISFFIVWSAILCTLLITQSISLTSAWLGNYKIYQAHEKTSNLIMDLDSMMLFIIESKSENKSNIIFNERFLSIGSDSGAVSHFNSSSQDLGTSPMMKRLLLENDILAKYYEEIDIAIDDMIVHYQQWLPHDSHIIDNLKTVKDRFSIIYNKLKTHNQLEYDPVATVTSYLELTELIERNCLSLDAPIHNINARHYYPINNIGLALYMKWMSRRTAEYALGLIYFQSSHHINISHFLELHYTSLDSLQTALQLEPQVQIKYWEVRKGLHPETVASFTNIIDAMTTGQNRRNDVSLKKAFRKFTLLEFNISIILRKYYVKSLEDNITYSYESYKKKLIYHVVIAMIAFFGIGMCLFNAFLKVFFSKESRSTRKNLSRLSAERESCPRYAKSRNDYILNNHSDSIKSARLSTRIQDLAYCPQDICTIGNHVRNSQDGYLI